MPATQILHWVEKMNGMQLKMARVALNLGVREAAELTGVSTFTITQIEGDKPVKESTITKVRTALETAGVIFIAENGEGPGVRLKKQAIG